MKSPPLIRAWHCAPRQNMAVIPGFPISALFEKQFYPISALFRIPSGTVLTARLHQTPIPTILQINGKTSRGDPAACGMEVRLIPRRPSTASRQCPHLVTQVYGEPAVPIHGHNGPHGRSFAKRRRHMNIFLGNDCSALAIRFIQIPIYSGLPNAHHHRNLTDRTITRQRHGVSER